MQHPTLRFFNFLTKIETSFAKHCNRSNAFELVVRDITEEQLEYPCSKHACDVYAYLITYYLQNRMRRFAKITMANVKKANAEKKIARVGKEPSMREEHLLSENAAQWA